MIRPGKNKRGTGEGNLTGAFFYAVRGYNFASMSLTVCAKTGSTSIEEV